MMRLVVLALVLAAAPAAADSEVTILGPAVDAKVPAKVVEQVKQALAAVAPLGAKVIDASCAADTACLTAAGTELRTKVVVGVAVAKRGRDIAINLVLVDVGAKELIAKRNLSLAPARLAKELATAVAALVQDGPVERAKDLFAQGKKHYELGEFTPALELYKRAYRAKALPAFLFNIAQCHRKLGQHKDAIAMYQSYLVGVPDAPNKEVVESLIAESEAALAQAQAVADKRAGDAVTLESQRIALEKKRSEDARKSKEAEATAAAERRRVEEARLAAERERAGDKVYDRHPARKWAILGGTVGVASALTGGFFTLRAYQAQAAFDDAGCGDRDRELDADVLAQCRVDKDRHDSSARLGTVFLAGGAGVLAASLMLMVIDPGNVERPARIAVTGRSIELVLQW